ncbi:MULTISPECIES: hypothetical protein [Mucilaginibacter]|uniref:Uncharacterized protein n=1 Tax=Mucilaginibacter rubeus TaxID=2027860 RepID=A0ABX7U7Z4_9SPHI|nr:MULTISPECIES: hypothetical protein [Mucilaginibacter]QTE41569.1 hypothetical protein J3L19_21820 [Mucilaginibacter rubeus]QTE48175.1 hypothetical protein J3L21_21820 [Mucilaginibacter rubeus]QTE60974.1 hypothetical protein J3L22_20385 [Mucilaginibacter rubeus]
MNAEKKANGRSPPHSPQLGDKPPRLTPDTRPFGQLIHSVKNNLKIRNHENYSNRKRKN